MKVYGFLEGESEAKVSQYLSYLYHIVFSTMLILSVMFIDISLV